MADKTTGWEETVTDEICVFEELLDKILHYKVCYQYNLNKSEQSSDLSWVCLFVFLLVLEKQQTALL